MIKPLQANEDKLLLTKEDYYIYEMVYVNFIATTKQISRAETKNIKKGETDQMTMENHHLQR